ncbi:MAG: sulfate permease SulP [Bacteroidetes bacterium HLUCCA01]|nr:MAG: sulfate permease SulP [Bacteroidetes bacterium HLUCCA01]
MKITQVLSTVFPVVQTLTTYNKDNLRGDLSAGVTVAIMLIPQGMAYSVLAGLPPVYGLYASLIPIILYALLGTSRQLAVGPVAMVSLLVLAGVGQYAEPGSERFIQLAIVAALGVGLVQFLMGIFRMGFVVNFLSHPVLSGFTSAAALVIASSQVKSLFGLDMPRTSKFLDTAMEAGRNITTMDPLTAAIGLGTVAIILGLRAWKKTFPSALVVVGLSILLVFGLDLESAGLAIVGDIPRGFPTFDTSFLSVADLQLLLPLIMVIALVSYMESIAVAKTIASRRGYTVDANRELVGLGMANIGGSFFQAFPTTGGFSRTAVNDQAGAKTPVASLISVALIGFTLLFLTPLFYYLPMAVLAGIIVVAVFGLINIGEMTHLWHTDKRDFIMLMVTFAATLFIGIKEGIAVGVVMSLVMVIYQSTRPHTAELGELGDSGKFRNLNRYPEARVHPELLVYRFDAPLYFANAGLFKEELERLLARRGGSVRRVVLVAASMTGIDSTGVQMLEKLVGELDKAGIDLVVSGATGPVRDALHRGGITRLLGEDKFYFDAADALRHWEQRDRQPGQAEFSPLQAY